MKTVLLRLVAAISVTLSTAPGVVLASEGVEALLGAMRMDEMIDVLRDEGLEHGKELGRDMAPDADPEGWASIMSRIYDADWMKKVVRDGFEEELAAVDLTPLLDFYRSTAGETVVGLEISARRAFVDQKIEQAARDRVAVLEQDDAAELEPLERFIQDSDLISFNVMGGMNANLMFYRGLAEGGALEMSEDEMVAEIWAQEEPLRSDTREWLFAFLLMAYQPLPADDFEEYAVLWRTPEGKALNRAVFRGFDQMYAGISYRLGLAVARNMRSQKL